MSRQKRPADSDLEDDDEESNVSSPPADSSSQLSSCRKRRRISDHSDTTPEQDFTQVSRGDVSDDDETEQSEDSVDVEAATQQLRQQKTRERGKGNVAKECGVLDSVELWDFMCHHRLSYNLGPLINFIIGKNGSGKSAILIAIILCLGGKASATNRGASLKRFIREGAEKSIILCKIRNKGDGAYMPDEYGDMILVERSFTRSGTSQFRLKSQSGRIVSSKRGDLDGILDHFALQIDNPLNVLSQDMARSFIGNANPAEKYKFFVKGVQLEQLSVDYRMIGDALDNIGAKITTSEEDVKHKEEAMNAALENKERAKKNENLGIKISDLARQMIWVQVRDQERIVQGYDGDINDADQKIQGAEDKVKEMELKHQEAELTWQRTFEAMNEAQNNVEIKKEDRRELSNAHQEAKVAFLQAETEYKDVVRTLRGLRKDIEGHQCSIADEEQRLDELNGGGAARRREELDVAKSTATQVRQEYNNHKAGKRELNDALQEAKRLEGERNAECKSKRGYANQQFSKVDEVKQSRGRQMLGFRPNTEHLINAINQERGWQERPIGPVGKHIRLLKPEWGPIIETTLGGNLSGFICFSKQDESLFARLARRVRCNATVAVINKQPINPKEPHEQFATVMRALEIDDEWVKKHLIIANAIEQHILIPDLEEATSTMYDNGRLMNVKGCFALHPTRKRDGLMLKYGYGGAMTQDPVQGYDGNPRMKSDFETELRKREESAREAHGHAEEAAKLWNKARADLRIIETRLKKHGQREKDLLFETQKADDEVLRLTDEISNDNVENGNLDQLKANLRECEESLDLTSEQIKDSTVDKDAKKREMQSRQVRLNEAEAELEELERAHDAARNVHKGSDREKMHWFHEKNNAQGRVDDAKRERETIVERRNDQQSLLEQYLEQANAHSSGRVNVPEEANLAGITAKRQKLQEEQKRLRRQGGLSMDQAAQIAATATKAYRRVLKDYNQSKEVQDLLKKSLEERRGRWVKFQTMITARARITFGYLLSERGFRGKLLMDHRNRLLDIAIEPDITRRSGEGRNTKTLSGGEKSFSQICLLLAMWEAMGSPIRCLDEFDVFMDAVNRNMSVKMIIEAARDSVGRQYILVSPGAKQDIPVAPDVRVLDLGEPKRKGNGQTAIGDSMEVDG